MSKKGFTMVELIASLVILTIVFSIGAATLIQSLENSKEESYKIQINEIKDSTYNYIADQSNHIPALNVIDEPYTITLQTLNDAGFVDLPIKNPKNGKPFDASNVQIIIAKQSNGNYNIRVEDHSVYQ